MKTEGEATKRALEIARAANCTIPRAASEGDENYDYTHDVFDVSRRLFKWRIVVFKIFVEYIQFMVEIYLSIFKNLLINSKSIVYYYFRNYEKEDTCMRDTCIFKM